MISIQLSLEETIEMVKVHVGDKDDDEFDKAFEHFQDKQKGKSKAELVRYLFKRAFKMELKTDKIVIEDRAESKSGVESPVGGLPDYYIACNQCGNFYDPGLGSCDHICCVEGYERGTGCCGCDLRHDVGSWGTKNPNEQKELEEYNKLNKVEDDVKNE